VPATQLTHLSEAAKLYVPAVHISHAVAELLVVNVPSRQFRHFDSVEL
jgi:hypothetical protein